MDEAQRLLGELGDDLPPVTAAFVADIGEEEEAVMRRGGVDAFGGPYCFEAAPA